MRRTIILGTIGAFALTIGLGVSATLASGATAASSPTHFTAELDPAKGRHIADVGDIGNRMGSEAVTGMMNGHGMGTMMGTDGMDAMHSAMHDALRSSVPAEVLAACDTAPTSMSATTSSTNSLGDRHATHHPGVQP